LLARGLTQYGNLLLKEGQASEAVAMLRRGLEKQEELAHDHPRNLHYQSSLASALRGVGRAEAAADHPVEARDALERSSRIEGSLAATYPVARYNLACDLALLIPVSEPDRREALAAQAIEALRQAISAGYGTGSTLKDDADLDALRPRIDFQSLLTATEAGTVTGK
jgi:hypothetical protein